MVNGDDGFDMIALPNIPQKNRADECRSNPFHVAFLFDPEFAGVMTSQDKTSLYLSRY